LERIRQRVFYLPFAEKKVNGFYSRKEQGMSSTIETNRAVKGAAFMVASNVAFCAMVCLVRYSSNVNAFTATMFRFVVGIAVIGALAISGRAKLTFVNKPGLFFRGLLGGIAICIGFISIVKLGMIKASVIVYTYPAFAAVFSVPLLGERLGPAKTIAFIGSFAGVFIVLSGGNNLHGLFAAFGTYEIIALAGSMLAGLSVVLVKQLQETESTATIYFAQCLVGFWLVIVPAGAAPYSVGYAGIIILVAIGLLAAAGQLVMTEGYRYLPVSTAALFVMIAPILNLAAGALLFHEPVTMRTLFGSSLVLVSCGVVVLRIK
jgi:drug/metabolite transporter (DMT)-like permease